MDRAGKFPAIRRAAAGPGDYRVRRAGAGGRRGRDRMGSVPARLPNGSPLIAQEDMAVDRPEDHERLRREAARIGITLPDPVRPLPGIGCCGHKLPRPVCLVLPEPRGPCRVPASRVGTTYGLLSPFGPESDLHRCNVQVRRDHPNWPPHRVSFWHGMTEITTSPSTATAIRGIVYWYYNNAYHGESGHLQSSVTSTKPLGLRRPVRRSKWSGHWKQRGRHPTVRLMGIANCRSGAGGAGP